MNLLFIVFLVSCYTRAGSTHAKSNRSRSQEKYDGIDQSTVNRHLNDLKKLGCLDWTPPSKKTTRSNRWNIATLKQLENIRQNFPDIKLNRYEKSLDIVSRYHLRYISPALLYDFPGAVITVHFIL